MALSQSAYTKQATPFAIESYRMYNTDNADQELAEIRGIHYVIQIDEPTQPLGCVRV